MVDCEQVSKATDRPSGIAAIHHALKVMVDWLTDQVMPPSCVSCQKPIARDNALCAHCWREVRFICPPVCDRLGLPMPYDTGERTISAEGIANPPDFDRARAVAHHAGLMRRLIAGFKYADKQNARLLLTGWLINAGAELLEDADLIVPVPLHRWRLIERRYNQSAILAKAIGQATSKPVAYHLLQRPRKTTRQVGLRGAERRKTPRGAFSVNARHRIDVKGRRILVVDDVITTGSTVNACARALKAAGAKQVDVLALSIATNQAHDFA